MPKGTLDQWTTNQTIHAPDYLMPEVINIHNSPPAVFISISSNYVLYLLQSIVLVIRSCISHFISQYTSHKTLYAKHSKVFIFSLQNNSYANYFTSGTSHILRVHCRQMHPVNIASLLHNCTSEYAAFHLSSYAVRL